MDDLSRLTTEQRNPASLGIDTKSTEEILAIICEEDKKVPLAIEKKLAEIGLFIDEVVTAFKKGGRLFYIGAGTSGRLGVLDASECPPTYGVAPSMVQGIIAGGKEALTRSIEWAEDDEEEGKSSLKEKEFGKNDVLLGITASGQAPFVIGAMKWARECGAVVGAFSCNKESRTFNYADYIIYIDVGPEIVTGSTRMKSGTAQKLVLNMITTTAMIRIGKVYNNLMVDLVPVNKKLIQRSMRLISMATECTGEEAKKAFESSNRKPKTAIVMLLMNISREKAEDLLNKAEGRIGFALEAGKS